MSTITYTCFFFFVLTISLLSFLSHTLSLFFTVACSFLQNMEKCTISHIPHRYILTYVNNSDTPVNAYTVEITFSYKNF